MAFALDDSVSQLLAGLTGEKVEHIGVMFQDGDELKSTAPQSTGQQRTVRAQVIIPKGGLRALFHNHPVAKGGHRDAHALGGGEQFSDDDKAQARKLGVPSYIITPSRRVLKFDPTANEVTEVLAQLDLAEIRKLRKTEFVRTAGTHNVLAH